MEERVRERSEFIDISIPKGLIDRVNAYCATNARRYEEFVIEAIDEKLTFAYKEKRKRPRL